MATLPKFPSSQNEINLLQTRWASILDPVVAAPSNNVNLVSNVVLSTSATSINHGLGQNYQGWYITRQSGNATIWEAPSQMPNLTLNLIATSGITISVGVF